MKSRTTSILLTVGYISLILAIIVIIKSPAAGYELSIYGSTPLHFWIFLILSLFIGIFILIYQAFAGNEWTSLWPPFFLLLLANFVFFSLAALRGYAFLGKGDALSHIGWARDIVQGAHFSVSNSYPITHVIVSQYSMVLGVSEFEFGLYLPALFTILFMLFILLLAKVVTTSKGQILLIVVSGAIVLPIGAGGVLAQVHPFSLFVLFSPIVFALYFLNLQTYANRFGFTITFIIVLLLYAFVHQLVTLNLILILALLELIRYCLRKSRFKEVEGGRFLHSGIDFNPVIILLIVSLAWVMSFRLFDKEVRVISQLLSGETFETSATVQLMSRLSDVGVQGFGAFELWFRMYGANAIYILIALVYGITIVYQLFRKKRFCFGELALLAACVPIALVFFVTLGEPRHSAPPREVSFVMVALTVFGGIGLFEMCRKYIKLPRLRFVVTTSIIAITLLLSMLSTYRSPYFLAPTNHVTRQDIYGFSWLIQKENPKTGIINMNTTLPRRFGEAILGSEAAAERGYLKGHAQVISPEQLANAEELSMLRGGDWYLLLTERDKLVYTELWPKLSEADFEELNNKPPLALIYSSGEFDIWKQQ
jgi:hypothetical protein